MNYDYIHFIFTMCKILLGDGADSSMSKKTKSIAKTWANKSRNNEKHFIILGTVYVTQHMEAEIGPVIPFWCESTFTAEKLSSFSGFNQNKKSRFYPPKQTKWTVRARTQTRKETCFYPPAGIKMKPPNDNWEHINSPDSPAFGRWSFPNRGIKI